METPDIDAVARVVELLDDPLAPPLRVTRLDGGYSWRTFRVAGAQDHAVILRIAPAGGTLDPYDPATEAEAIRAGSCAVPVPPVLLVEASSDAFGAPFSVHGELEGTVVRPRTSVPDGERGTYRQAFAETLGSIHRLAPSSPMSISQAYARELQVGLHHYIRASSTAHPGFEIGFRWLLANIPARSERAVLCHGDYRLANLLWSAPGVVSGVLDWERSWRGDPMADVAFTRLFSGWCAVDDEAISLYEAASRLAVDEERVAYGMRFERWRSFTSSMRGLRALLDGRNDDVRLLGIGLAGDAGAWDLVDWLEPDLPVLKTGPPLEQAPLLSPVWLADAAPALLGRFASADDDARTTSLDALRDASSTMPAIVEALRHVDPEHAWSAAFGVLAAAARSGGPELKPALKALALRATLRPQLREEQEWR